MIQEELNLESAWRHRLELYTEYRRLYAEGNRLQAESDKLLTKGGLHDKSVGLYDSGNSLFNKGDKLRAEGDRLWAEAVLKAYGKVKMEWENWNEECWSCECHLENGKIFGFQELKQPSSQSR